jgi:heme-degrading monooxygenase HmoA
MATISKDNKVVTLINVFTVRPEDQERLATLLARVTEETMCKMPGFISASFHKSADGVRVVNYAQWASREAWEAIFTDPEAKKHIEETMKLGSPDYHLYEVSSTHEGR